MTIKETEEKSGLARANIRYYESEGLLDPARRPNGYRDYSEEDLLTLLRVRLLRSLGLSLEDIKAVRDGDLPLPEALERHLDELAGEQVTLSKAETVCRAMKEAGVDYDHLNAVKYLEELERARSVPVPVPESDVIPKVQAPWRRYFARCLDVSLYSLIRNGILLSCGLNRLVSLQGMQLRDAVPVHLLNILFEGILMVYLESPLLHWFGTTPGKALLGLRVQDPDGGRLSFDKAFLRTLSVLFRGMGLCIPIVNIVQEYRSYEACTRGKTLPWEEDSVLMLRDAKAWRTAVFVVLFIAIVSAGVGVDQMADLPVCRGDLTVAEFCENFNRQADRIGYTRARLNPDGTWKPVKKYGVFVLEDEVAPALPKLTFTETGGAVTGLSFSVEGEGDSVYLTWGQNEMALALWAFVGAQPDCGVLHRALTDRFDEIRKGEIHSFEDTLYGVHVRCSAEWTGRAGPVILGTDGQPAAFSVAFTMEKA